MSEQQAIKGKVKKIFSGTEEEVEEFAKELCEKNSYEFDERFFRTYIECLIEEGDQKYIVVNSNIYKILEEEDITLNLFEASENPDGTISFLVSYYNGGYGFEDAIEEALKNMEEE